MGRVDYPAPMLRPSRWACPSAIRSMLAANNGVSRWLCSLLTCCRRNFTATPPGLLQFWMGHAGEGMSDLYDKIKSNVAFRKQMAEKAGLGFELPSRILVIGPNGLKIGKFAR